MPARQDISGFDLPVEQRKGLPRFVALPTYDRAPGPEAEPWFLSGSASLAAAAGTLTPLAAADSLLPQTNIGRIDAIALLFDSAPTVTIGGAPHVTLRFQDSGQNIAGFAATPIMSGIQAHTFDNLNLRIRHDFTPSVIETVVSTYTVIFYAIGWFWHIDAGY